MQQFYLFMKVFTPSSLWYVFKSFLMVGIDSMPVFGLSAYK